MKIKLMLTAVLLVSVAGCAGTNFVKPGVTQQQAEQDKSECIYSFLNGPWGTNPLMAKGLMKSCMKAKGYQEEKQ